MYIYLDESGDLGYRFDKPFRNGGSSRYMTIAFMLLPADKVHIPIRKIRKIYKKYKISPSTEKKGADLGNQQRTEFCTSVIKMLEEHPDIQIGAITVYKENVHEKMKEDQNILYNYMIMSVTISRISHKKSVFMVPDRKPIKVKDINQCKEYLQAELIRLGSSTTLEYEQQDSHEDDNLIFIDWICNTVWKHYEDNMNLGYDILCPKLIDDFPLYFPTLTDVGSSK